MKRLILILTIAMAVLLCFTACDNQTEEPTPTPRGGVITENNATPMPRPVVDYDSSRFVMDGVTLVKYIGSDEAVEIPDGTMIIGDSAFRGNTSMKSIVLKDSLTTVGSYAFEGCSALETVEVPKLVRSVGDYCFKDCTALTTAGLKTMTVDVGVGCFEGCTKLEKLTLSTSMTNVKDRICYGCKALTELKLVAATSIGKYAFYGCESLVKIEAPACLSVGDYCFYGCKSFGAGENAGKGGNFSTVLTSLGTEAFTGTAWLDAEIEKANTPNPKDLKSASVVIGANVLVYYSGLIPENDKTDASELHIYASTKTIGPEAFRNLKDTIVKIDIPANVARIEKGAFKDFDKLKEVKIPKNVSVISEEAFADCDLLESVVFNNGPTEIGDSAFRNCPALKEFKALTSGTSTSTATAAPEVTADPDATADPEAEAPAETEKPAETAEPEKTDTSDLKNALVLPAIVTKIGDHAFSGCTSFENIVLGKNLTVIGKEAFSDCTSASNVVFGDKVAEIGVNAFAGTLWFENSACDEEHPMLIVGDGVLLKVFDDDIKKAGVKSASVILEEGFTEMPSGMFSDNDVLYSIVIPGTVKTISDYAFYYAENLYEVIIEDGVENIGNSAFYGCRNLARVRLPETLVSIGDYAFYGCADLTEIDLPETVKSIGKMAYYNCLGVKTANIPATVENIGAYAFTNTYWRENAPDKYLIAGDGILVRYNAFETATVIKESDGIKRIAGGSFSGTYVLSSLTLPESITELGEFAVSGCNTLAEITAKGVAKIGPRAFNQCSKLTTVSFAAGFTAEEDSFAGCTSLAN